MKLYSIRDGVAEEFGPVFMAPNHGVANRNYVQLLDTIPEVDRNDYGLFYLGQFDFSTGVIEAVDKPEQITWKEMKLEDVNAKQ